MAEELSRTSIPPAFKPMTDFYTEAFYALSKIEPAGLYDRTYIAQIAGCLWQLCDTCLHEGRDLRFEDVTSILDKHQVTKADILKDARLGDEPKFPRAERIINEFLGVAVGEVVAETREIRAIAESKLRDCYIKFATIDNKSQGKEPPRDISSR